MADALEHATHAEGPIGFPPMHVGMNRPTAPSKKPNDIERYALLLRAQKRFDQAIQAESANRQKAVMCLRFKASDQWEPELAAERAAARRPRLTENRIPTFVNQVVNDQRQNRPAINISPVGDRANVELAQMERGLIMAIERDSDAELAYDTAFESAVDIGWGYWRYLIEWAGTDSFQKRIRIVPIPDTMAVYFDTMSTEPEGSDAKWCFVTQMMARDDFKREYPDVNIASWEMGAEGDRYRNWGSAEEVRVAEYFEIETEKRTLVQLGNGHVGFEDELSDYVHEQSKAGDARYQVVDEREVEIAKVMWYKMIANAVIDEEEWAGSTIPVVRTIYERVFLNGKIKYSGIIERMLDPQRMLNYWLSAETEALAMAPKAAWQIAEGQDEGYEDEYEQANLVPNPVVHYRPVSLEGHPVPPPIRQQPPAVSSGYAAAKQGAATGMMAVTGIRFDATPQERNYDESGRALRELERIGDLGTFHAIDNLSRALRRGGEILLELIPKVYDEAQVVTILGEDGKEKTVRIDPHAPAAVGETRNAQGALLKIFNPTVGKFAVTVTIGPSFKTKRIEAADQMMHFVRSMPQAGAIIMDLIAKNLDWPGAEEIAARLAKAVPPNLLAPTDKDMSPQVQALLQGMQQQLQQALQERTKLMQALNDKQADRALVADKTEKDFEAKLLAIVAKVDTAMASHQANTGSQLKDLAQAVKIMEERLGGRKE